MIKYVVMPVLNPHTHIYLFYKSQMNEVNYISRRFDYPSDEGSIRYRQYDNA